MQVCENYGAGPVQSWINGLFWELKNKDRLEGLRLDLQRHVYELKLGDYN